MSTNPPQRAIVLLDEEPIGALVCRGNTSRFEPFEQWANEPTGKRRVLGQQFEEDPQSARRGRFGAPTWFEHLLPEEGGPLRRAVARSLRLDETRSFALLVALGENLPGAVRIRTDEGENPIPTIARRERTDPSRASADRLPPPPMRVSLAGLQFKISAREGKRGISVPARGEEGDWILKFADQRFSALPSNEFWTMRWAQKSGIDVPEVRLQRTDEIEGIEAIAEATGEFAFAIRRYDRTETGRVHQEDFAQVLGLELGDAKYFDTNIDTIVRVVSVLAPGDIPELLSRLVFCVIAGNDDAHAKNFALWYPEPTIPRLSPAYDLVATLEFLPANDMSLKLAKARRFADVDRSRFRRLAERAKLDPSATDEIVVQAVRDQLAAWSELRDQDAIGTNYRALIDDRVQSLPLVSECR